MINPLEILKELSENESKEVSIIDTYLDLFLEVSSKISESIYIKGNVLLNVLYKESARHTLDLDMSVISKELYYESVVPELKKFGEETILNKLSKSYTIRDIEERKSGGIDIKNNEDKIIYSVDVSLSDIYKYSVVEYNFNGVYAYGSSINKILADKVSSTLSIKRFRRVKDFYDLYIILNGKIKYDVDTICRIITDTIDEKDLLELLDNIPFSENILIQLEHAWDKLLLLKGKDKTRLIKPNMSSVINKCYELYYQIGYVVKKGEYNDTR